ncbi:MAG: dihydrolipoyl dehydrogenase, partial [Leptospiraceae bacterium]|nr:dihydrolipoyl dehydrogenase [Leptospiraceae bacterium]
MKEFDLAILGAGPGGYVCAIRAAQLGMKVAIIEKRKTLGGTCLNVGCIPSKALLDSSEHFHHTKHKLADHGINVKDVQLDLKKLLARKDQVVKEVCDGVDWLMNKNKVEKFHGHGKFISNTEISISKEDGTSETIKSKNIVIATGSVPIELPGFEIDGKQLITSDHAINLPSVPKHLLIIGAGVIGLELGSVWSRLGAEVSIIELLPKLFGSADKQMSSLAQRIYESQGLKFYFEHKVTGVEKKEKEVTLKAIDPSGKEVSFKGDVVLVSVGRKPYTEGLGAKELGIQFTNRGRIQVDPHTYRTNIPNIYAIGDVIDGPMLAHKAEDEGIAVAEIIAGKPGHVNYMAIPWIVYTWP